MERREFLTRGLVLAAAGAGTGLIGTKAAHAATTLYSDGFKRAATARGWGKPWFSPRYEMPWGVSGHKGYFVMNPEGKADPKNPNPVLVLDRDVADVDIVARMGSANRDARFGLVARAVGYGDFYAVYVDRGHVRISRFTVRGEKVLAKAAIPAQTDSGYWIRFNISGGDRVVLKAKVWRGGRSQPHRWSATKSHSDPGLRISGPGAFGTVFLHDSVKRWTATVEVDRFRASSARAKKPTSPAFAFSYAGRITSDSGVRMRVVARTLTPAKVSFRWSTNSSFSSFTQTEATDYVDDPCVAKGWLAGLPADSVVYWNAEATTDGGGSALSPVHSFKTPPAPGKTITFAFGSCTHWHIPNPSFGVAAAKNPDFFVHLGDFGYAAAGTRGAVTRTAGSYQDRWTRMHASEAVAKVTRKAFWIGLQDDQDYGRENAWKNDYLGFTVPAWNGLSANLNDRFFATRYGDAHLFFTDSCLYADKKTPDAGGSLLGAAQKRWLKSAMSDSNAPVLVVFMPRQLRNIKSSFANEYNELIDFFLALVAGGQAVLICSGNSHLQYMGKHPPAYSKDVVYEFCSSGTDRADQRSTPGPGSTDDRSDQINAFGYVEIDTSAGVLRMRSIGSDTGRVILERNWPL